MKFEKWPDGHEMKFVGHLKRGSPDDLNLTGAQELINFDGRSNIDWFV
jgi:hypothetical protein